MRSATRKCFCVFSVSSQLAEFICQLPTSILQCIIAHPNEILSGPGKSERRRRPTSLPSLKHTLGRLINFINWLFLQQFVKRNETHKTLTPRLFMIVFVALQWHISLCLARIPFPHPSPKDKSWKENFQFTHIDWEACGSSGQINRCCDSKSIDQADVSINCCPRKKSFGVGREAKHFYRILIRRNVNSTRPEAECFSR